MPNSILLKSRLTSSRNVEHPPTPAKTSVSLQRKIWSCSTHGEQFACIFHSKPDVDRAERVGVGDFGEHAAHRHHEWNIGQLSIRRPSRWRDRHRSAS